MPALRVVKHLDVIEHIASGLLAIQIDFLPYPFSLEKLEEAFRHGIVVAIAPPTHARYQVVLGQEGVPVMTAELTARIGMHHDRL